MAALKIALIGYGKMGKAIEEIALAKGYKIVLRIGSRNLNELTAENLQEADVAIEFTNPESVVKNLYTCIDAGVPVVCGSTGWGNREEEIKAYCLEKKGTLLYASNFSIGVNIFFEINKKLAALMSSQSEYAVMVEEIHHTAKKDAPSGTAITIAQQIINERTDLKNWSIDEKSAANELHILSKRIDPAPGTHFVRYTSEADEIEIIHTAHNRSGFAAGALTAAAFLSGKKGIFSMADVLQIA
jgi:4-hydroxy-tetrahydrodipicolinate reductase